MTKLNNKRLIIVLFLIAIITIFLIARSSDNGDEKMSIREITPTFGSMAARTL